MLLEIAWDFRNQKKVYHFKEALGNLGVLLGNNLLRPLSLGWKYLIFSWFESMALFSIPIHIGTVILTFLVGEFVYYWCHRLSHELPLLWTMHHTHHSSPWMNLTTAVRLNWMEKFIAPFIFIPFVLRSKSIALWERGTFRR